MEHVSDLLCQADPGSAVGSDIDSRDAAFPSHFWSLQEQNILLWPEGADLMRDVIADHDDLTAGRVLRGSDSHPPCYHANLENQTIEESWALSKLWSNKLILNKCLQSLTNI